MGTKHRDRGRMPSPAVVVASLALIIAASGVAVAAIPGSDGAVSGCVGKSGTIRVIDAEAGRTCSSGDTTVRFATVDALGKVRNADALDGHDATDFLGAGAKAVDSDALDGQDATDFLGASAKAVDADRLDGKDSGSIVRLAGFVSHDGTVDQGFGFRVERFATGRYHIDFPPGTFTADSDRSCGGPVTGDGALPLPTVTPYSLEPRWAIVTAVNCHVDGSGLFQVMIMNSDGTPVDSQFIFHAG